MQIGHYKTEDHLVIKQQKDSCSLNHINDFESLIEF